MGLRTDLFAWTLCSRGFQPYPQDAEKRGTVEKKDALFYGQAGKRLTILKRQSHSEVSAFTRGRGPGRILFSDEALAERLRSMLRLETVKGARADRTHKKGRDGAALRPCLYNCFP